MKVLQLKMWTPNHIQNKTLNSPSSEIKQCRPQRVHKPPELFDPANYNLFFLFLRRGDCNDLSIC